MKYKRDGVLDKNSTMDDVQKRKICTNLPSSQTYRSYRLMVVEKKMTKIIFGPERGEVKKC
jgi:hypothetical protein